MCCVVLCCVYLYMCAGMDMAKMQEMLAGMGGGGAGGMGGEGR